MELTLFDVLSSDGRQINCDNYLHDPALADGAVGPEYSRPSWHVSLSSPHSLRTLGH